jgi:hypothetical protein
VIAAVKIAALTDFIATESGHQAIGRRRENPVLSAAQLPFGSLLVVRRIIGQSGRKECHEVWKDS